MSQSNLESVLMQLNSGDQSQIESAFETMRQNQLFEEVSKALEDLIVWLEEVNSYTFENQNLEEKLRTLTEINILNISSSFPKKRKYFPEKIGYLKQIFSISAEDEGIKYFPASFHELKKLQLLHLNQNELETIPEYFGEFRQLTELDLAGNLISVLPESIVELKNLKTFNISENHISELPENFGNLSNLKYLDLSHTEIEKLPASFYQLKQLEELNLFGAKLSEEEKNKLVQHFPNCKVEIHDPEAGYEEW